MYVIDEFPLLPLPELITLIIFMNKARIALKVASTRVELTLPIETIIVALDNSSVSRNPLAS